MRAAAHTYKPKPRLGWDPHALTMVKCGWVWARWWWREGRGGDPTDRGQSESDPVWLSSGQAKAWSGLGWVGLCQKLLGFLAPLLPALRPSSPLLDPNPSFFYLALFCCFVSVV